MLPVPTASVQCRLKSPCFQSNHLGFGHGEVQERKNRGALRALGRGGE